MHFSKSVIKIGFFSGEHLIFKNEDRIFLLECLSILGDTVY